MTFDIGALESFDSVKGDVNTLLTLASELILEADKKKKTALHQQPQQHAVIHVSFDGLKGKCCGVGTFVSSQVEALRRWNLLPASLDSGKARIYTFSPDYLPGCPNVVQTHQENMERICKNTGGRAFYLKLSEGRTDDVAALWAQDVSAWKELSTICAKQIHDLVLSLNKDKTVQSVSVVVHDTQFAAVTDELFRLMEERQSKVKVVKPFQFRWIPHSTAVSIRGRHADGEPVEMGRHVYEVDTANMISSIQAKKRTKQWSIWPISKAFQRHLEKELGFSKTLFAPFESGILINLQGRKAGEVAQETSDRYLQHLNEKIRTLRGQEFSNEVEIPLAKQYVFAAGMCLPVKGHDLALKGFAEMVRKTSTSDLHFILLAPTCRERARDDGFASYLEDLIASDPCLSANVTWIQKFDGVLARHMYANERTLMTSLLVRDSPQDLIPMESRVEPVRAVLLTSNRGANRDEVLDGNNGFMANIDGDVPGAWNEEWEGLTGGVPASCKSPFECESQEHKAGYAKAVDSVAAKMLEIFALDDGTLDAVRLTGSSYIQNERDCVKNLGRNFGWSSSRKRKPMPDVGLDDSCAEVIDSYLKVLATRQKSFICKPRFETNLDTMSAMSRSARF